MTITLKINGVDRTSYITNNSLRKNDVLNEKVDTLQFSIKKYGSYTFIPAVGDTVELLDTGTTIFSGIILTIEKTTEGHNVVNYAVHCVDNTFTLSRTLVAETYTSTTINAIIGDIITNYAPTFTTTNVDADVAVESVTFNRVSITQALQKLASLSNYSWYVDYDNDIHFFAKSTELAPFNITDTSANYVFDSLEVSDDISQLRNRVFIEGGEAEGDARDEYFNGDGTKKFFKLSNKFARVPTVTVGGVSKTVGVDFLDDEADFDVLWDFDQTYLKFTAAPASGTNNILVNGIPLYSILVQVEDTASIAEYGLSEFTKTDRTIKSKQEAKDFAIAQLEAYSSQISEGSFTTYTSGLRSGQTISITSTLRNVAEDFIIQSVSFSMVSQSTGMYRVQLATLKTVTLIDFLITQLRLTGTLIKDNENILLQKFLQEYETVPLSESFTAQALNYAVSFRLAPQVVTGTLRPFIIEGSPLS